MVSSPITTELAGSRLARVRWWPIIAIAGVGGWLSFAALIVRTYSQAPPASGFDLELLLTGARRVADGLSPYEPAMLAGQSVGITTLFYSYPPLVAQALAPITALPSALIYTILLVAAPLAAAAVASSIAARFRTSLTGRQTFLLVLALLPFWFPFTLAMLFGNFDALFVALYGLVLLAILPTSPTRTSIVAAGAAVAIATLTKLHPAVLGVWLLARGVHEWRRREPRVVGLGVAVPRSWAIAAVAAVVGLLILAASLVVGGIGPWADYLTVLKASTVVDLLDVRNLGPAVQVALLLGLDASALAPMQSVVVAGALLVTVSAALAVDDPLESLLWATFASLVVLPVTWFHHFAVLLPFGVAALARGWSKGPQAQRRLLILTALGFAGGVIGFGKVIAWVLLPISIALVRVSRPVGGNVPVGEPGDQAVASAVVGAG